MSGSTQFKLQVEISGNNSDYTTAAYVCVGATSGSPTMQWDACFTEGSLVVVMDDSLQTTYNPTMIVVERSRNWSDAVSNIGATLLLSGPAQGSTTPNAALGWQGNRLHFSPVEVDSLPGAYVVPGAGAPVNASTLTNNTLPVYPFAYSLKEFTWNSRALISVPNSVSALASLDVTVGGTTRHYRTPRVVAAGTSTGITGYHMSGHINAYRWD